MATAKAKKAKMLKIEQNKRKNVPLNEQQKQDERKRMAIKNKAKSLLNEEKDDVKEMNKMIMYAKVVTVRDKQLN